MLSFFKRVSAIGALVFMCFLPTVVFAQQTPAPAGSASTSVAPATIRLSVPIGSTREVSNMAQYIAAVYRYGLGLVTTVAIIMVMYGGFQYLLGATMTQVKGGQQTIENAIGGLIVLLLAYTLLYFINPETLTLRLPNITPISEIGISQNAQNLASTGGSCVRDTDCRAGSACLRTSPSGGLCADGRQGNICKCRGTGCDITDAQAGGPTNNSAAQAPVTRGNFACQSGLTCGEVSADDWQCVGGTFSACNESEQTIRSIDNAMILQGAIDGASSAVGAIQDATPTVARWNIALRPFTMLASGIGAAPGAVVGTIRALPQAYEARVRQALHCSTEGQYCLQPYEGRAGACVFGDQRDNAVFDGIEEYRTNAGLRTLIENCSASDEYVRTHLITDGGCQSATGILNDYCVAHRYQCRNSAICTQDLGLFARTRRAYGGSSSNVPHLLSPSFYVIPGCKAPIGHTCTSDSECATGNCVNGTCPGFRFLDLVDGKVAGEACTSDEECLSGGCVAQSGGRRCEALRSSGTGGGIFPEYTDLLRVSQTEQGCSDNSWSAADLFGQAMLAPTSERQAREREALDVLNRIQGRSAFACFPARPNGAHCDFDAQCTSSYCSNNRFVEVPVSLSHPLDQAVGAGICGAAPTP